MFNPLIYDPAQANYWKLWKGNAYSPFLFYLIQILTCEISKYRRVSILIKEKELRIGSLFIGKLYFYLRRWEERIIINSEVFPWLGFPYLMFGSFDWKQMWKIARLFPVHKESRKIRSSLSGLMKKSFCSQFITYAAL